MQVVCATCQLSFDAPEGATGLVCPICRGPLRPQSADGGAAAPKAAQEWSGGDLDDLIAILSAPAVSARVEVLAPKGEGHADEVLGEVHLLAGGVSESIFKGKSTDDALDRLRALNPTRFRVEQRLPNPIDGSLTNAGPETGTLDGRALAHLMRYCEDYVISCAIEVWRGNETARVEYRRGEISGVTVGGIDAPERLAEVMQWSSGNYRLIVPPFQLPETAPKRPRPEKAAAAPVPAASAQAARASAAASPTKTIFGMPVADIAKTRFPTEAAKPAATPAPVAAAPAAAVPTPVVTPPSQPVAASAPAASAPAARPAPTPSGGLSPTRTIYGVPAPQIPEGFVPAQAAPEPAAPAPAPVEPSKSEPVRTDKADKGDKTDSKTDKKMGARKTVVPAPAVAPPPASAASQPIEPTTRPGYETRAETRKRPEPAPAKPEPARPEPAPEAESAPVPKRGTSIAAYVGVGFAFGLALLGIYELYAMLGH